MRTYSLIRKSVFTAALVAAFAAAPMSQVFAQDSANQMQKATDNQTVPDKAADTWITTKVKSEFGTTENLPVTDISVTTVDGVVTLSGHVASDAVKQKAEQVAAGVKGVKSVEASGLTVGGM